ncbi:acyl-[acyl-carrier-protein]--UDP-N-acetylglucosamine O-acyltransferase, partial [candidate division WOR-3 bacterium]|nr:acyl-[acyl-carrier-protein]--UDP-N-acetylglucosamine O-acyltransferase [candidate division WOR-3 bacterium]
CRVGRLAMVGAHSYVNKDIPPFVLAAGRPCRVRGLNQLGLRRAGTPAEALTALKQAFRLLYRSGLTLTRALATIEQELVPGPGGAEVRQLVEFCRESRRGVELRDGPGGEETDTEEAE